jgi:hypothetical protein
MRKLRQNCRNKGGEQLKTWYIDFQSWSEEADSEEEARQKAVKRLEKGERPDIDAVGLLDDDGGES